MQLIIRRQIAHALFLSLALPACGADAVDVETPEDVSVVDAAVTSASTGQGIMVDVDVAGSLALVTNQIYEFSWLVFMPQSEPRMWRTPALACAGGRGGAL